MTEVDLTHFQPTQEGLTALRRKIVKGISGTFEPPPNEVVIILYLIDCLLDLHTRLAVLEAKQ